MKKSTAFWMSSAFLFFGMVLGFFISPAKHGFGNDCGNTYKIEKYIKKDGGSIDD